MLSLLFDDDVVVVRCFCCAAHTYLFLPPIADGTQMSAAPTQSMDRYPSAASGAGYAGLAGSVSSTGTLDKSVGDTIYGVTPDDPAKAAF